MPSQINGVVTTYRNIEKYASDDGFYIQYLHPEQFKHFTTRLYPDLKFAWPKDIGYLIKAVNPDYIHIATEGPMGIAARLYLSRNKIPYTTAYHTKFPEALKKILKIPEFLTWPLIRWFHKDSHTVLTTTPSMVKQLQLKGFENKVSSWTRGVDRSVFVPAQRIKKTEKVLVCVSRVSAEKNLEAFFNLKIQGTKKIMVGDGPKLACYKKAYSDVEFVGAKTGKDLAEYYQQADVFVFPSRWDTFGLVMIESMACGTPVAAYSVQGPLDVVVQGVNGVMEENLEDAVEQALELKRNTVYTSSLSWNWQQAWQIFKDTLVSIA